MRYENVLKVIEILAHLSGEESKSYLNLYYIENFVVHKIMCRGTSSCFNYYTIQCIDLDIDSIIFADNCGRDETICMKIQDIFLNSEQAIKVAEQRVGDLNKRLLSEISSKL